MLIYRGIINLKFSQIDPLFKNSDDFLLDYGKGTSYAYERALAVEYAFNYYAKYGWIVSYEFNPKNPLNLYEDNFVEDEFTGENLIYIDGDFLKKKELSSFANKKGFDCVIFDDPSQDPHIFLLDRVSPDQLILNEIEFFAKENELINALSKLNIRFYDNIASVSKNKIKNIDNILNQF